MRTAASFILLALIIGGCNHSKKIDSGERETFIAVYTELTLARSHFAGIPGKFASFKDKIFRKHRVDERFMTDFLGKIASDPNLELEIFQTIADRLSRSEKLPPDSLNRLISNFINEP